MSLHRAGMLSLLGAFLLAGCKEKKEDDTFTTVTTYSTLTHVINPLLRGPLEFSADGGTAFGSATSRGGGGGSITANCRGNILVGLNPPPQAPPLPAAPVTGTEIASWSNLRTVSTGNALVNGAITVGSSSSVATLTVVSGDLVINGSISTLGETNLFLNVMGGTVFFHGSVRTGRVDGTANGTSAGNLTINALRIVFTGAIDTRGEDNPAGNGGFGGSVNFVTDGVTTTGTGQTSQLMVGGSLLMSGGNAAGPGSTGGAGGNYKSSKDLNPDGSAHISGAADGVVYISGTTFNVDGGSATGSGTVSGGSSGYVYWMGDGGFLFDGAFSGLGGGATSSDGEARGGSGTAIFWNEFTPGDSGPISVFGSVRLSGGPALCGPAGQALGGESGFMYLINGADMNFGGGAYSMRGGDSAGHGGQGGSIWAYVPDGAAGDIIIDSAIDVSSGNGPADQTVASAGSLVIQTDLGDIQLSGSLLLDGGSGSGGASMTGPSAGGHVQLRAGDGDVGDGGSITLRGLIQARGGSDSAIADDTSGAAGGTVEFICDNPWGSIYLDPGSSIQLDGGNAGGPTSAPNGGPGGLLLLRTTGGRVSGNSSGGHVSMRGSIFARGGSGGGSGGAVTVQSDSALVTGGNGDGRGGDITLHAGATIDVSGGPVGGAALNNGVAGVTSPCAVIFDADGNNSNSPAENGIVQNLGLIIAHGMAPGGNGGDIRFDGLGATLGVGPAAGSLDLAGVAPGLTGGFRGE